MDALTHSFDADVPATAPLYAGDVAALLEHLGIDRAPMLGIAGIGSCPGQELAIGCPERVRSLAMSGTWARADAVFRARLALWRRMHEQMGFYAFSRKFSRRRIPLQWIDRDSSREI